MVPLAPFPRPTQNKAAKLKPSERKMEDFSVKKLNRLFRLPDTNIKGHTPAPQTRFLA